jgi:hypothetical protein
MFNMVQAYGSLDKIPTLHLDDAIPSPDGINSISIEHFLPSDLDEIDLRSEMTTMVERVLCEHLPMFHDIKCEINWHLYHQYSQESSAKSICVSF